MPSVGQGADEEDAEVLEDETHSRNPYDLRAIPGSVVTASYPFRGEENLQQLSFAVSKTWPQQKGNRTTGLFPPQERRLQM